MVLECINFKQVQKATSVPKENTEKVVVNQEQADYIFVGLPEFWIRVDLADKTFSVGAYEG